MVGIGSGDEKRRRMMNNVRGKKQNDE